MMRFFHGKDLGYTIFPKLVRVGKKGSTFTMDWYLNGDWIDAASIGSGKFGYRGISHLYSNEQEAPLDFSEYNIAEKLKSENDKAYIERYKYDSGWEIIIEYEAKDQKHIAPLKNIKAVVKSGDEYFGHNHGEEDRTPKEAFEHYVNSYKFDPM